MNIKMAETSGSPLVSIVTPCLNRADLIEAAIDSVLNQHYAKVEHIIVDGGSTDGTLEVLRRYPHLVVSSEPDAGTYDGFNKGIAKAGGDIIGILNSDDLYEPDILPTVVGRFSADPDLDAVLGMADLFEEKPSGTRAIVTRYDSFIDDNFLARPGALGSPAINAHFFRRRVFSRFGQFDLRYRLAADIDFFLRLIGSGIKYSTLGQLTYHYRLHPGSLTLAETDDLTRERAVSEQLTLAEIFLNNQNLSSEALNACRKWHTKISIDSAGRNLKKKRPRRAVELMFRGLRYEPLWPIYFIGEAINYSSANKDKPSGK